MLGTMCHSLHAFLVIGSCRAAGYNTCCIRAADGPDECIGEPSSAQCYCDQSCETVGDCCDDYDEICDCEYTMSVIC